MCLVLQFTETDLYCHSLLLCPEQLSPNLEYDYKALYQLPNGSILFLGNNVIYCKIHHCRHCDLSPYNKVAFQVRRNQTNRLSLIRLLLQLPDLSLLVEFYVQTTVRHRGALVSTSSPKSYLIHLAVAKVCIHDSDT